MSLNEEPKGRASKVEIKAGGMIDTLKEEIQKVKNEYNHLNNEFVKEMVLRGEAQSILQKCLEDLKFEIVKTKKGIENFSCSLKSTNLLAANQL